MAIEDFTTLVGNYSSRAERTNIAVGLRPSGVIHLGNMATLCLSGVLGKNIGPHLSQVNVTICDLDLPDAEDWSIKEKRYVRYFESLPDPTGNYDSLLEGATVGITSFISGLEEKLGVPFKTRKLSEIQREPRFREGLKKVLDTPGIMQYILKKVPEGRALVFPLCPECRTSDPYPAKYLDGMLASKCKNPDCSIFDNEYDMKVLDSGRDLAVHFFIDPLRDKTVEPYADIHVFGGDYNEHHYEGARSQNESRASNTSSRGTELLLAISGDGPILKIQKIMKVMEIASDGRAPDILLGPIFYARDGAKMSKSQNNGLSMDRLREHFLENYVGRVTDFIQFLCRERYKNVDYKIVEDYLLTPYQ